MIIHDFVVVDSVVEWLKRRARDQHSLGSKLTHAILLCLGKDTLRHFLLLDGLASCSKLQSYLY